MKPDYNRVIIRNLWPIRHDQWARHSIRNAITRIRNQLERSR